MSVQAAETNTSHSQHKPAYLKSVKISLHGILVDALAASTIVAIWV